MVKAHGIGVYMAFQMIHLVIADRLLESLDWIENRNEFILGSVSPDSVHMDENYQVEMKVKSHIFENCGPWGDTQDYEQWIRNVKAFWKKYVLDNPDKKQRDYAAGVCVHCYTDYWNDLKIWRYLGAKFVPPMDFETFKVEYYAEARKVDGWLYQNTPNAEALLVAFKDGDNLELDGLMKAENIIKQKEHMINVQYNLPEKISISAHTYYTKTMLINFIETAISFINSQIKEC